MADNNIVGWYTKNGKHIPIFDNTKIAKDNEDKKNRDIQRNQILADALNNPKYKLNNKQLKSLENQHYREFEGEPDGVGIFGTRMYEEESSNDVAKQMLSISNADYIIRKIRDGETDADIKDEKAYRAFEDWTMGEFMDGQQYRGFGRMTERQQKLTRQYDKYIDQSVLKEGITVVRRSTPQLLGLPKYYSGEKFPSDDLFEDIQDRRGCVIRSLGNMSTSCATKALHINNSEPLPIVYHIHIPGGTKGAGLWIGDNRINDEWGSTQREFMMNRDTVYAIGSSTRDEKQKAFIVHLYYLGREEHSYK